MSDSEPPEPRAGPRILAIGGGGFTAGARDQALDAYIVDLLAAQRPSLCLLPTASGDPGEQIARFEATFRWLGCETSHVSLFRLGEHPVALREHLLGQDAIYVGGGSLINLVAIWRAHGLDAILEEAWRSGVLLCGVSAGSMCWFEAGVTKSHGAPQVASGLGLLEGSNCVHYDSERDRRPVYHAALRGGELPGGWGVSDGAALLFEGPELREVVTARAGVGAQRVDLIADEIVESPLEGRLLEPVSEPADADPALAEYRALWSVERAAGSAGARTAR